MMLMRSAKICNLQIPLLLRFSISIEVWQSNSAMKSKNEQGTALHNPLCFFSVAKQPALWPPWASEELLLIILIFILILIIKCGKPFAFGL